MTLRALNNVTMLICFIWLLLIYLINEVKTKITRKNQITAWEILVLLYLALIFGCLIVYAIWF